MSRTLLRIAWLAVAVFCSASALLAQVKIIRFDGGLSLSSELYSSQGITPRRPQSIHRAILTPTITLFDQVRLPFEIYVSSEETGFRQPFNQFGVSPRLFGWLTLHAGYYSAQLSELTFGDGRILGGGVELTPGIFRVSAIFGRIQNAIQTDTLTGIRGAYDRIMYGARIGIGTDNGFHVDLNFFHAVDDSNSMQSPRFGRASDSVASRYDLAPRENAVISLAYGFPVFGNGLQVVGEVAVSALSNDTRSKELANIPGSVTSIFTPRYSTQIDGATTLGINFVPSQAFSIRFNGKWVGPGFVSLGFSQMPNDVLETTVAPAFRFFNGDLTLRTSLGFRYNNLRENRSSTTRRTIGSASVTMQPTSALGFDLQYTNYGMRSSQTNDTLRIDNISQSFSIAPRYVFESFGGNSTAVASYSLQDYTDYNVVSARTSQNSTQTVLGVWTLVFPSSLSFSTMVMHMLASMSIMDTKISSVNETVGYSFFNNLLSTSLTFGYNVVTVRSDDGQFNGRFSASYNTKTLGTFTLSLTSNNYNYGDPASGSSYGEYQGSLTYSISL